MLTNCLNVWSNISYCSHQKGKRVMYRVMEYKPLLDSSNMMETDWGKIASDLFVSLLMNMILSLMVHVGI